MNNKPSLPQIVAKAYPFLTSDTVEYIGRFTPKVPVVPDRIYDLYGDTKSKRIFTHATVDYPDPIHDSGELWTLTDGYRFINLIKPNSEDDMIPIVDNDEEELFFVTEGGVYHYVANTRQET